MIQNIDKQLVRDGELVFLKDNNTRSLVLTDDGIVEYYNEGKLIESKPFSKLNVERDYKQLIQEGYCLSEDKKIIPDTKIKKQTPESEASIIYYNSLIKELDKVQHQIENAGTGDISSLESRRDFIMDKLDQLETPDESNVRPVDKDWVGKMKDTNGTFFDVYLIDDKYYDKFGNEVEEDIVKNNLHQYNKTEALNNTQEKTDVDLQQAEKDIQADIEQVDRVQKLKDELNDKVDKLLNETTNTSTDFLDRDWKKLQKDPMINAKEHWSDAYYSEVTEYGKSLKEDKSDKKCIICGSTNLNGCYEIKGKHICNDCGKEKTTKEIMDKVEEDKHTQDYIDLDRQLDNLIRSNATDKELNDFLERASFNEVITNLEYLALQKKAQNTRTIDLKNESQKEELTDADFEDHTSELGFPSTQLTDRKLTKPEIEEMTQIPVNEKQLAYLNNIGLTEEDIIKGLQDLVKEFKGMPKDYKFMSIKEYIDEFEGLNDLPF